jgi:hypothetical protein
LVYKSDGTLAWLAKAPEQLERHLRIVQLFAILAIICVLLLYSIPVNRNLKGILLGYSLFVASSVFQLTLLSYFGDSFKHTIWPSIQPCAYVGFLLIWAIALWSAAPEPVVAPPSDSNYDDISTGTTRELGKLHFDLRKAPRQ